MACKHATVPCDVVVAGPWAHFGCARGCSFAGKVLLCSKSHSFSAAAFSWRLSLQSVAGNELPPATALVAAPLLVEDCVRFAHVTENSELLHAHKIVLLDSECAARDARQGAGVVIATLHPNTLNLFRSNIVDADSKHRCTRRQSARKEDFASVAKCL